MQFHRDGFRPGDPDVMPPAAVLRDRAGPLPAEVDVLIAGTGPAGLCLAAQLAREPSIRTMIVDPRLTPMEKGQADGINVRSMEMFQAFGFADRVKRESVWINETTFWKPDDSGDDHQGNDASSASHIGKLCNYLSHSLPVTAQRQVRTARL